MAPEFAELPVAVPQAEHIGSVFKLRTRRGTKPTEWWVSKVISTIGEMAGVKVDERMKGGKRVIKYARS